MLDKLLPKLFGDVGVKYIEYKQKKRELRQQVELEKLRGKIEYEKAKSQRAAESEGRDHEWETLSIQNSGWKDEWVLIILSIPLVLVFIPYTQQTALDGFEALAKTPDWYRWLTMMIFAATYGIRLWRRKIFAQA